MGIQSQTAQPMILRVHRPWDEDGHPAQCPFCLQGVEAHSRDEILPCPHLGFAYLLACTEFAYISPQLEPTIDAISFDGDVEYTCGPSAHEFRDLTSFEINLVKSLYEDGQWRFVRVADDYSAIFFGFRESLD